MICSIYYTMIYDSIFTKKTCTAYVNGVKLSLFTFLVSFEGVYWLTSENSW